MTAGNVQKSDAQRIWFPEMIDHLRTRWQPNLSFETLIALRNEMEAMLLRIRAENQLRSPLERCLKCGHLGEGAPPPVSVRSMILALTRFGIVPAEEIYILEKSWATHRKQHGLDLYGKAINPDQNEACRHTTKSLDR